MTLFYREMNRGRRLLHESARANKVKVRDRKRQRLSIALFPTRDKDKESRASAMETPESMVFVMQQNGGTSTSLCIVNRRGGGKIK